MKKTRQLALVLCCGWALGACSEDAPRPPADLGVDISGDARVDLRTDAPPEETAPQRDGAMDSGDGPRSSDLRLERETMVPDQSGDTVPAAGFVVHLKAPAGWAQPHIHYWGTAPDELASSWPGTAMSAEGGGWFSFSLSTQASAGFVFSDQGRNQTIDQWRVGGGYFVVTGKDHTGKLVGRWFPRHPELYPVIEADPPGGNFYGESVSVALQATGTALLERRYTLDGSDPAAGSPFQDAVQIEFGTSLALGGSVTLRLWAKSATGSSSVSYRFVKRAPQLPEAWTESNKPLKVSKNGRWVFLESFNNDQGLAARHIKILLPADYDASQKRYRVVYFHDGQNLFEDSEASFGQEWMVDEHYDELIAEGLIHPAIIVGVWSTGDTRTMEYVGGCDSGDAKDKYAAWVVHSLKPYIDHHYRTKSEAEFTTTMGSSFGGIISWYLSWNHPQIFGQAGCVSTAFFCGGIQLLEQIVAYSGGKKPVRYWIDAGYAEDGIIDAGGRNAYVVKNRTFAEKLAALGWRDGDDLGFLEVPGATHSEQSWSERVKQILYFLLRKQPPRLARLELRAPKTQLPVGSHTFVSVDRRMENGLQLTKVHGDTSVPFSLTVSDPQKASVELATGRVSATSSGPVSVEARYGGLAGKLGLVIE